MKEKVLKGTFSFYEHMKIINSGNLYSAIRMCRTLRFSLIVFFIFCVNIAYTQDKAEEESLIEAIHTVEKKNNIRFFYKKDWIESVKINSKAKAQSLIDFLDKEILPLGFSYLPFYNSSYIVLFKGSAPSLLSKQQKIPIVISTPKNTIATDSYTLSGHIEDAVQNEVIIGATIFSENEKTGVLSDVNGNYSIKLKEGTHRIRVTAIGKLPTVQEVNLFENKSKDFEMYEQTTQLDEVVVLSESATHNIASSGMSQIKMDIKAMKTMPPFMGEVDVVKSILMLPGVSTVGEGASGFNVRGGTVDQNLILQDDAPLFNSSHLFGFFSAFNPDFVKDVTLYKGGMPSSYGGRISSVLDVKLKDGNAKKISGSGGLGIVSSRLALNGPLGKKTTFILGGRYAYPNWIIKKVPDLNVQKSSGNFYDVNFKLKHQFNYNNGIVLSAYRSLDRFKFAADTVYGWSSTNFSLKWNTVINSKLFASITGVYTKYENTVEGLQQTNEFETNFGIDTKSAKVDFIYTPDTKNKIEFGLGTTNYVFNTGKLLSSEESSVNEIVLPEDRSVENGIYVSDEIKVNSKLLVNVGVRLSQYSVKGNGDVYVYDENQPKRVSTITDTLSFGKSGNVKQFFGFEPRLSIRYSLDERSSIKLSFNRNYQYLQLISNTTAVSPLDLWKSSNYYIKPQIGNQFAAGYFRNFNENQWEFSVEGYFKRIENLTEYKDGANLFLNPYLESELLNAKGIAYGAEFLLRKNSGKLTGWIAYTYSRSLRQVKGDTPEETINFGKYYPSNFDKPSDVVFVGNYAFTKRLSLSANFTFSSGRPITYPQSVYIVDGYSFAQFSQRNQGRIPAYHRLDLSFTIEESLKKAKKWKGSWTFSLYNAYGRKNPYSVFFKPQYKGNQTQSYRLSVIGTIIPSITYNFKF